MAAEEGFEPSQTESESVVLPLHNSAIDLTLIIISHTGRFVNSFLRFLIKKLLLSGESAPSGGYVSDGADCNALSVSEIGQLFRKLFDLCQSF